MKIIWIEINQETASYYITKAKFKTWWGKEFVSTCISEKGMSATKYFDSGRHIPINLWASFRVFLESNMDYIKNNMD